MIEYLLNRVFIVIAKFTKEKVQFPDCISDDSESRATLTHIKYYNPPAKLYTIWSVCDCLRNAGRREWYAHVLFSKN